MSTEIAQINALLKRHVAAANAGDVEAYGDTLAHDVVFMPPDSPRVSGKDNVMRWVEREFFSQFVPQFRVEFDEIRLFGAVAIAPGSFTLDLTPKSGGEQIRTGGRDRTASALRMRMRS